MCRPLLIKTTERVLVGAMSRLQASRASMETRAKMENVSAMPVVRLPAVLKTLVTAMGAPTPVGPRHHNSHLALFVCEPVALQPAVGLQ
jgi:hypothetical protein